MPTATVPGFLVDAYNRPAVYAGGALYRRSRDDDRLRPPPPNHFADYLALLAPANYRRLVSECRALASGGLVAALLEQKSDYVAASHFAPRFCGNDTAWGAAALDEINEALKICNLRGPRFNWRESWRLSIPTRATDGRFFVLLTSWGETGWPALQFLEGHRIGNRDTNKGVVGGDDALTRTRNDDGTPGPVIRGAYAGLLIDNGIIYNAAGTEVAYRVLGAKPEEDEDISARDLLHIARPARYSEGSTPPELARAYLDFLALRDAQTAQLDQQIHDAKLTVVETNETGRQPAEKMLAGLTARLDGTPLEMVDRGAWRYVKSGQGRLESFKSERPSDQWMNFDQRVASRAAAAIRWRVEMLDPEKIGSGAANRAFQDQINTAISDEFAILEPHLVRVLGYFASKLIALGRIPASPEWMCWGIAPPPWFEVDRNSARIDLEELAAGRVSLATLQQRDGRSPIEVMTERATTYETAQAVHAAHPAVPLDFILGNGGAPQPAGQAGDSPDKNSAAKKLSA